MITTTAEPALDAARRRARHHLDQPCDDGRELAHHLVAKYLTSFDAGAPTVPTASAGLLPALGRLFAAVAERHSLDADDPALTALAEILLDPAA